jgi:hypothetical protein
MWPRLRLWHMLPGWLIQTGLRRECVVVAVQLEPRRTVAAFSDVLHQLPEDSSDLAVTIKHDLHMIAPVVRPGQLCLKVGQARTEALRRLQTPGVDHERVHSFPRFPDHIGDLSRRGGWTAR